MINLAEIQQYFPNINKPIRKNPFTFTISLSSEKEETFILNLKIKQDDTKKDHLIKFRIGIGKDDKTSSKTHDSTKPHFEIDIYDRKDDAFSANVYFTFKEESKDALLEYAKGTIVIISKIINSFVKSHSLNPLIIKELIYEKQVIEELGDYESILIDALYECYKKSELIVRQDGETITIKTPYNVEKYLGVNDLKPLYLPLMKKIKEQNS